MGLFKVKWGECRLCGRNDVLSNQICSLCEGKRYVKEINRVFDTVFKVFKIRRKK